MFFLWTSRYPSTLLFPGTFKIFWNLTSYVPLLKTSDPYLWNWRSLEQFTPPICRPSYLLILSCLLICAFLLTWFSSDHIFFSTTLVICVAIFSPSVFLLFTVFFLSFQSVLTNAFLIGIYCFAFNWWTYNEVSLWFFWITFMVYWKGHIKPVSFNRILLLIEFIFLELSLELWELFLFNIRWWKSIFLSNLKTSYLR